MLCISFPYFLLKNYKRGWPRLLLFNADDYSIAIIRCFYYLNLSVLSGTLSESILC